jgi:hypothetical protein
MTALGKLVKVDLREAWKHEALDFTKWLALEENLDLLSEQIGFDIKLVQTEARVGSFNVDILAVEENTDNKIIIENQLEVSNHDHLGKLITYASGYDAKVIIWVVKDVREEHRSAIEWLNENTIEDIGFYLLKIEAYKIGDSLPAPKFEIICKPNEWARTVKENTDSGELGERNLKQLEYWDNFKNFCKQNNTTLRFQKSQPRHWTNISIGSSECKISLTVLFRDNLVGCEFYVRDNKDIYFSLLEKKDEIEKALNMKLEWMELPEKKASRIKIQKEFNLSNKDSLEKSYEWLQEVAEKFKTVFEKQISQI